MHKCLSFRCHYVLNKILRSSLSLTGLSRSCEWSDGECCHELLSPSSKHRSSLDDSLSWLTVLSTMSFGTCCCFTLPTITSLLSDSGSSTDGEVSVEVGVKCLWWDLLDFSLAFFFLWWRDVTWYLLDVSAGGDCSWVVDTERWREDLRERLCLSLVEADLDRDLDRCRGLWWDRWW